MAILNEEELLEDTAEMFTNYMDVDVEVVKDWLERNSWFMDNLMSEMWEAQSNYIACFAEQKKLFEGGLDEAK